MNFAYFPALISVGYKFREGPFTSESQLSHPKCVKSHHSSPVIQSTDHSLPYCYCVVWTVWTVCLVVSWGVLTKDHG